MANDIIDINVSETIETVAITVNPNLTTVNINQVAGDKGDDTTKLDFAKKAAVNQAQTLFPNAVVTGGVIGVSAKASSAAGGEPMSATEVRKDAYRTLIPGSKFTRDMWFEKYERFYGRFARPIYDVIARVASETERTNPGSIQAYIDSKSGGYKTKKRSNLKKRRTQRKKRRTTRRK